MCNIPSQLHVVTKECDRKLRERIFAKLLGMLVVLALLTLPVSTHTQQPDTPTYLDPKQPIEVRVQDLMSRMTLKEKVGQLNLPCVYVDQLGKNIPQKMEACKRFAAGTYTDEIGPGSGFFTLADTILHEGVQQQVEYFNALQRIALTRSRLKIPLLEDEEGTHGAMFSGATVFPEGLALGSSFDMPLINSVYATSAREARAVGIHVLSTLVLELDRDPRMGRNEEAYTEDPYLYSRIAEAIVRGAQGPNIDAPDRVVALMTDRAFRRAGAWRRWVVRARPPSGRAPSMDIGHHQKRRARSDGRLSRYRRHSGPRLREVDERCLTAGTGI